MHAKEIADALPDAKKADKLLDAYLKSYSRPLGKFKPGNYFNNTKARFLNVKTDDCRDVVRALKKKKDKKNFRAFVDGLWNSGVFEKMSIAAECYAFCDLKFEDFGEIVKGMDNWAHCDSFCGRVSGPYFHCHPEQIPKLAGFARSKNPWSRRFATVSLINVLRDPDNAHETALVVLDIIVPNEAEREVLAAVDWMMREYVKKNYRKGLAYMKKWSLHHRKTGDNNVRWVLVRARHKLKPKDKKVIEKMIDF